jgi:soluble lytic murein transglycosylase
LWQEGRGAGTVRRFFDEGQPTSALGRLALARVVLGEGDRARAEGEVRAVWQSAELSPELEGATLETFRDELSTADHRARVDRRIGAKDFGAAMRSAKRLGDDEAAIVKACVAVEASSSKSGALLDAVPENARQDLATRCAAFTGCYVATPLQRPWNWCWQPLARIYSVRTRMNDGANVARWPGGFSIWATPRPLTAWCARPHPPSIRTTVPNSISWPAGLRCAFSAIHPRLASISPTLTKAWPIRPFAPAPPIGVAGPPKRPASRWKCGVARPDSDRCRELLHAADILYTIGEHELAAALVADLGQESIDVGELATLGELTAQHNDARAMLLIGRGAVARGLPLDEYAFPTVGVPPYSPIGPGLDRCVVYSIVRTESGFDQRDMSSAKAVGLMQVTPEAGRDTAKRFGVAYKWDRLVSDPVYNTQMGAAEVAALFKAYRGSYIMTFAGYNAGRGRVQEWWRSMAILAIPKSMRSTGSNASRSPRPAITSSV